MNSVMLEYFVMAARLGSLSRAALELGVEQSTMTRQISRLEPLYCIMAPNHEFVQRKQILLRELLAQPLVLPSTHHGLKTLLQTLAKQEKMPLNQAIECDGSIAITKRLVEAGHGLTVLSPAAVMRECAAGHLCAVPIADKRMLRTIGMATARNRPTMKAKWEVNQIIRQVLDDLMQEQAWPGAQRLAKPDRD